MQNVSIMLSNIFFISILALNINCVYNNYKQKYLLMKLPFQILNSRIYVLFSNKSTNARFSYKKNQFQCVVIAKV